MRNCGQLAWTVNTAWALPPEDRRKASLPADTRVPWLGARTLRYEFA